MGPGLFMHLSKDIESLATGAVVEHWVGVQARLQEHLFNLRITSRSGRLRTPRRLLHPSPITLPEPCY